MSIRKWLACLLIALLAFGAGASAGQAESGTIKLPESTEVIGQEAFMDAASVRSIVLPEGVVEIHERAFAGSSVRAMNLPESIGYIAEDAFADCEKLTVTVLRDSYAHHYVSDQNMRYTIIEPETDVDDESAEYVIHHVEYVTEIIENLPKPHRYFKVNADMAEPCGIYVRFFDEEDPDGEPIQLHYEVIEPYEMGEEDILVVLPYEAVFPEYFILEMSLIRVRDNKQMGEPYITYDYTKRHAEIMGKTQEDYEEPAVISYGDAGYAVLAEGVIRTEGMKTSGGYVLTPPRELKKGDVLYLDLGDKDKAVKVKSFEENDDGTVTVTPDKDISLSEIFKRLDISGYMQPVAGAGLIPPAASAGEVHVIPLSPSFEDGPVTVKGTAEASVMVDITHDKDADYFGIECWVEVGAEVEISLTGGFNTREDLEDDFLEVSLGPAVDLEIPGIEIGAELGAFLPVDVELDVGGSIFVNVKEKVGFTCNSDDKIPRKIEGSHGESNAYAKVKGDVTVSAGPEIRLGLGISDALEAEIRGQVGLEVVGTLEGLQYGGSMSDSQESSRHACSGCLNGDFNFFAGIWATLKGKVSDKIEFTPFDEAIISIEPIKLGDAYWSFLNDEESIYGGKPSFGFTECKNHQYRVIASAVDVYDKEAPGTGMVIERENEPVHFGNSPTQTYLYNGDYTASAFFKDQTPVQAFSVKDAPCSVVVREKDTVIYGRVLDKATNIGVTDVKVRLTMPDGRTMITNTDYSGYYDFDKLPGGVYALEFEKASFSGCTVDNIDCPSGESVEVNVTLVQELPPIRAWLSPALISAGEPAVATDTKGNEIEQEILFSAASTVNGFYGTCASELLVENNTLGISYRIPIAQGDDCYGGFLYGADLGDGAYTYLVTWGTDNFVNKTKCVVLRDGKNGMTKALDFTFSGETDNVYGLGKEYDSFIDYNNIQPSDKDIGYGVYSTDGEFKKKYGEPYTLLIHTNEADFTNGGSMITYEVDSYYQLVDGQLVIVDQKIYKKY